jgi:hypothetical protein
LSSRFIIQYHDAILNPGLFTWCCWATNRQVFNIKYCSHHHNSHDIHIYIYMQCPGLHNTGPTHMWLLFCCVYYTPSWKWSSLEYESFSDSTWRPLWPCKPKQIVDVVTFYQASSDILSAGKQGSVNQCCAIIWLFEIIDSSGSFNFSESKNHWFWFGFLREKKKAELERTTGYMYLRNIKKTNSFHERTGKEPVVVRKKVSFF